MKLSLNEQNKILKKALKYIADGKSLTEEDIKKVEDSGDKYAMAYGWNRGTAQIALDKCNIAY